MTRPASYLSRSYTGTCRGGRAMRIDIGCGTREQKYAGCIGLDINPRNEPDIVSDCNDPLPFQDETVEFINSDNSLEHVLRPYDLLREMHRVLIPEGTVRLVVPNARFLPVVLVNVVWDLDAAWHWWMSLPFKRERGVHWTHFTRNLAVRMVEAAGFRVDRLKANLLTKNIELTLSKCATPSSVRHGHTGRDASDGSV